MEKIEPIEQALRAVTKWASSELGNAKGDRANELRKTLRTMSAALGDS